MKTFEVYSLYDTQYRGRTLVATVQADFFGVEYGAVNFFKSGFFGNTLIGQVRAGEHFAVLDTEFSLPVANSTPPDPLVAFLDRTDKAPEPKKRRRKENPLDLG